MMLTSLQSRQLGKLSEKYFDADVIDYDSIGGKKAGSGSDTEAETEGVSEAGTEGSAAAE